MPNPSKAIEKLATLLEAGAAAPAIKPERFAPSAIYDLDYRIAVVAVLFERFAKPFAQKGPRRISTAKLKLMQFVALRPWLLPTVRDWSKEEGEGSLALTQSLRSRRGFLSDTAYEDVISFLVACGVFFRTKDHLVAGSRAGELAQIATAVENNALFKSVTQAISELQEITLTRSMLEGW